MIKIDGKRKFTPEELEKLRISHLGQKAWNKGLTGIYSKESLKSNSDKHKGKRNSPNTEFKKGEHKSPETEFKKGNIPPIKKGSRIYYKSPHQGEVCFRSTYEFKYAMYLDSIKEDWYYELERFDLVEFTYTPDFYLPEKFKFVEIKGYLYEEHKKKMDLFMDFLEHSLEFQVLYKEDLLKLGCDI